jgi:hypothetical protein
VLHDLPVVEFDFENPVATVIARTLDAAAPDRLAFDGHRFS